MKSTWQNINSVLNKTKVKNQFPDKFKLDAQLLTDIFEIANQCKYRKKTYWKYSYSPKQII